MLIFFFLLGTIVGSFTNSLIYRFGTGKKVLRKKRSYCPHCRKTLAWFDLIPLVSFILLLGRCRYCKRRISFQYPLVELAVGLGFALSAFVGGVKMGSVPNDPSALFSIALSAIAIFVFVFFFVIDARYFIIPDQISLPLIVVAMVLNIVLAPMLWLDFVIAGILGAGFFLFQYAISKGAWVGAGDFRLGALLGVLLGLKGLVVALVVAYLLGLVVALVLLALKKATMKTAVPFGSFLMIGGFVSLFFGADIITWYITELPVLVGSLFIGFTDLVIY